MKAAPQEEYEEQNRGFWNKVKDRFGLGEYDEYEEYDEFDEPISRKRTPTLRLHSTRENHVSVWQTLSSFDNAKQAAEGLKQGHQQIVNLEKAAPDVATKILDFLYGVVYALEGNVEKIGDKVYLFAPSTCIIEVTTGDARKSSSLFHDN